MERTKQKFSSSRLYLTALAICIAVAAIALLFAVKPVTSAGAEESDTPVIAYTESAIGERSITHSYPTMQGSNELTSITSHLKKDGAEIASAVWSAAYPDEGPNFAGSSIPIETVFTNKTGLGNDYSYETLPVAAGTYTLMFDYYYKARNPVELFSNEITFTLAETLPLPEAPTKEGHTFTGWYLDEDCTQPYDGRPIYADTQLYAGWEINTYTVTFNSNGGEAVEALTVDWNSTPSELPTPTREGHTFLGWFDGDSVYDNAPVTENKTLTAHWQINTYTVTFMSDGEVYKEVVVEWGTSFQTVMNANGMAYFNLLTTEGAKMSKGTPVKSDMTVAVEEMTGQEKAAEFFAQNWWVLIVAGVALVIVTAIIVSAVKGKRR